MNLKQITEDNFSILLRCIAPSNDLLGRLRSVQIVKDRIPLINQQHTDSDKNNALLNVLCEVPDDIQESVINGLVSSLRSSGQEHVANIFRRESDKVPMSDEHCRILVTNQLCKFIDAENGLLDTLLSTEVISFTDAMYIRAMTGYNEKAQKLLEVLRRKSDDSFDGFVNALNETRQSHVTHMLTGEGSSRPLKEEHRNMLLASKREYLVDTIDSKNNCLITFLMSKGVFSVDDQQRIIGVRPDTNYNRNEIILDLIARKSQSDFYSFISALKDTDQTLVAVNLIGIEVVAKIKSVFESGAQGDVCCMKFTCENVEALYKLHRLYTCGKLEHMFSEAFCPRFANRGLKSLKLEIPNEQFMLCADRMIMTPEHRNALLSSNEQLVKKLKVTGDLLDKLSLPFRSRETIEGLTTHDEQVRELLNIVSRRPDSAFTKLISALNDTDQHEAAAIINAASRTYKRELLN